MLHTT